ncbi:MAG: S-methyl-5-thioribose-1-phosphate isomerase [Candidatus Bathyarchaeota archaeon]|nr:S-methyl-5-thioribose-1-phosphate isomerase [Candidatus Bathyarchaeota archaeon]
MKEIVDAVADKIRKLQVQGARNVAIAAVQALQEGATQSNAKNKTEFLAELSEAQKVLFATRDTEPLMRNAVRWVISQVQASRHEKIADLTQTVDANVQQFLVDLNAARESIAETGAKRIKDGMTIFTHCHSTTATRLLAKAKRDGKTFKVICTETRPAFQGRITAREMVELGVDTTFIVDSAARTFMKQVDMVIVGADGITSEGNVVNKIGTGSIAVLANEARKPFYVVSELLKFNPETIQGATEKIEQRSPEEVWKDAPVGLCVRNPAFDVTPHKYIHGLICEEGIVPVQSVVEVVRRRYPWILN